MTQRTRNNGAPYQSVVEQGLRHASRRTHPRFWLGASELSKIDASTTCRSSEPGSLLVNFVKGMSQKDTVSIDTHENLSTMLAGKKGKVSRPRARLVLWG